MKTHIITPVAPSRVPTLMLIPEGPIDQGVLESLIEQYHVVGMSQSEDGELLSVEIELTALEAAP